MTKLARPSAAKPAPATRTEPVCVYAADFYDRALADVRSLQASLADIAGIVNHTGSNDLNTFLVGAIGTARRLSLALDLDRLYPPGAPFVVEVPRGE